MPELIKLEEALEGIMEGIVEAIRTSRTLDHVKNIIYGDKSKPGPTPPTLWIRGLQARPNHSQRSYAEKWEFDVLIMAIVKNSDPEKSYKEANALAARARSAVLRDRTLGKRRYVQDVRSGTFEPSGPDMRNESLSAATAVIQVHFVILEENP